MKNKIAFKILVYSLSIYNLTNGFCGAFFNSMVDIGVDVCTASEMAYKPSQMKKHFYEVFKHRPAGCGGYWFGCNDRIKRIKILETAIEKLFDKL